MFPVVCRYGQQGWTWIETQKNWANFLKFQCRLPANSPKTIIASLALAVIKFV